MIPKSMILKNLEIWVENWWYQKMQNETKSKIQLEQWKWGRNKPLQETCIESLNLKVSK